jgi:Leucine-rich repeat (LRR) protein
LDIDGYDALQTLYCYDNQLTSLNISNCDTLNIIHCSDNQLTSLDVSDLPALETLVCMANKISSLRAGNCPSLNYVDMYYNRVKAAQMGQFVADLPMRSQDNMGELYVMAYDDEEYEAYTEGNVITVPQVNQAHDKVWEVYHVISVDDNWEPYAGSSFLLGDVNNDNNVIINDVTALINYLLGGDDSDLNLEAANCNGDNGVNISDVTTLINFLLSGNWPASKAPAPKALAPNAQPQHAAPSAMLHPELDTLELVRPVMRAKRTSLDD